MNPSLATLKSKLGELEQAHGIDEMHIKKELETIRDNGLDEESCPEWKHEVLAFSFVERPDSEANGTYFGSQFALQTNAGEVIEFPNASLVDGGILGYWVRRYGETTNPLMRARYSDLVWDLTPIVTGERSDYLAAQTACESYCELSEINLYADPLDGVIKLKRALSLALSLNNSVLIQRAKLAIINLEEKIAVDDKPGLWEFSFDLLVGDPHINLTRNEEQKIISDLEGRLSRLQGNDPWAAEQAGARLAAYYQRRHDVENCHRVIKETGRNFETLAKEADPQLASSWLEHVHDLYTDTGLTEEARRISQAIESLAPQVLGSLGTVSHQVELPKDELDAFANNICQGTIEEVLARIVVTFAPARDRIEAQLRDLARESPLMAWIPKQLIDEDGRPGAEVGSVNDDLDGNIAIHMSQNLMFESLYLHLALEQSIRRLQITPALLIEELQKSPAFAHPGIELLKSGVQSYFQGDYVSSIHILIPQIEAAIRNIVKVNGGAVLKQARGGGFVLRTLDDLLRDTNLVGILGADASVYLRVVLTDRRGWNVRDDVCHGSASRDRFRETVADRLMHILILLGHLRAEE